MKETRKEKYKEYRLEIERSSFANEEETPIIPLIEEEDLKSDKGPLLLSVEEILQGLKEPEEEKKKKHPKKSKSEIIRIIVFATLLVILLVLAIITGIKAFS